MNFYFTRTGPKQYTATQSTAGAWNETEQHISPTLGLIMHIAEVDRDSRRDDHLPVGRVTYEIFGVVPIGSYDYRVKVVRPGRTIELVEVVLEHAGRIIVDARIWFMRGADTNALAGSPLPAITLRDDMDDYPPVTDWRGEYLRTLEGKRRQFEPGRAHFWARTGTKLVDDAPASAFATACGMLDIANGMSVRQDPTVVAFPNVELTTHFFRQPEFEAHTGTFSDWLGHDISVSFGPGGMGVTHSVVHDDFGPFAHQSQCLTVRP